jgi:urease accessory protein
VTATATEKTDNNWHAYLELKYQQRETSTVLAQRRHHGPLLVQRPFYPEQGVCHTYIIHPPGGVVGGDQLQIDVQVQQNAHALLTTPASGKFYNSHARRSRLQQTLHVAQHATLEWLPQDNIFFEGSHASLITDIELADNARFIGWEISCLGRPFSGMLFDSGHCQQKLALSRNGVPILIDNSRLQAGHGVLSEKWGLAGYTVTGTLMATPADRSLVEQLRTEFQHSEDFIFSVTLMNDVLLCRFLGRHGETARLQFERAWQIIRPHVIGLQACSPRIWKT